MVSAGAHPTWVRKRWRALLVAMVATLVAAALVIAPRPVPAGAAETAQLSITTFRDMAVDPGSGRVFVSGDDSVWVFAPDGTPSKTITGLGGAAGLEIDGSSLWVAETSEAKIARIDLATLAVADEVVPGVAVSGRSLAVFGGGLWFASGSELDRWDLTTSTRAARGTVDGDFEEVAGSTSLLVVRHGDYPPISRIDTSVNPAVTVAASDLPTGGAWQIAVDPVAGTLVVAWAGQYPFTEHRVSDLGSTGVVYPGQFFSRGVALSANRGVYAGTTFLDPAVHVAPAGKPASGVSIPLRHNPVTGAVAVSPIGDRVYVLTASSDSSSQRWLETFPLGPTITARAPAQVVVDVPDVVSVAGTKLLSTTKATIGGVPAPFHVVSDAAVEVTMPTGVGTGTRALQLTTAYGVASTSLTVLANTGATLSGAVRVGSTALVGMRLTLTGGSGGPRVVTSGGGGAYAFTGLPYATDYQLLVHDPYGLRVDQVIGPLEVRPNRTLPLDIGLSAFSARSGARLASARLPFTTARDLLVEPATGRVLVTGGDELDVLDHDGRLIRRITSLPGASGLARHGTDLYLARRDAGEITRFDLTTLAITGSYPTQARDSGSVVFAGGRLWFGRAGAEGIASLDLTTGSVVPYASVFGGDAGLRMVEGSDDRFLAWNVESPGFGWIMDVSSGKPVHGASAQDLADGSVSTTASHAWTTSGTELRIDDLTPDGTTYPTGGGASPPAYSPARGGVLAFGPEVARLGTPVATHELGDAAIDRSAFDAGADRLHTASSGRLDTWDLTPHLDAMGPLPIGPDDTDLTLTGSGLRSTSRVEIDGVEVPMQHASDGSVDVTSPNLAVGPHTVRATTAWGESVPLTFDVAVHPPRPVVSSLSPRGVLKTGGTVTITGSHLAGATAVSFAGVNVPFGVVGDSTIVATVPAHAPLAGIVQVTGPGGRNTTSDTFAWVSAWPEVRSLSATRGSADGGTAVTLSGVGLQYASSVQVGGAPAAFAVVDDHTITFTTPPGAPGLATVTVTTPVGTSASRESVSFEYLAVLPVVTSVVPAAAPVVGGAVVTLKGTHLAGTNAVAFGGVAATSFTVVDDETVTAVTPPSPAGVVGLEVAAGPASSTSLPIEFAFHFTDVPPGSAFYDDIEWAATHGIARGYPDGTYRPGGSTSRQAMAALFYRVLGSPLGTTPPPCPAAPFVDVGPSNPFCTEIALLRYLGITTGDASGAFHPNATVSRQAMAAFLYRLLGSPVGVAPRCSVFFAPFTDVPPNHPFCGEITYLQSIGVLGGFPDGSFHPGADVSRGAVAAFLHRVADD